MYATEIETPFPSQPRTSANSRKAIWAGRVISGLAVLFLTFDAVIKVLALPPAVEGTVNVGYPAGVVVGIGILQSRCQCGSISGNAVR